MKMGLLWGILWQRTDRWSKLCWQNFALKIEFKQLFLFSNTASVQQYSYQTILFSQSNSSGHLKNWGSGTSRYVYDKGLVENACLLVLKPQRQTSELIASDMVIERSYLGVLLYWSRFFWVLCQLITIYCQSSPGWDTKIIAGGEGHSIGFEFWVSLPVYQNWHHLPEAVQMATKNSCWCLWRLFFSTFHMLIDFSRWISHMISIPQEQDLAFSLSRWIWQVVAWAILTTKSPK